MIPVAPPGSISPEEHARAVMGAYTAGFRAAPQDQLSAVRLARDPGHAWADIGARFVKFARVGLVVVEGVERE